MSYRLDLTAPVPDTVRATAVERLERARAAPRGPWQRPGRSRPWRPQGPEESPCAAQARATGDAGQGLPQGEPPPADLWRELSGGRDADVLVETADTVAGALPGRQASALHRRLAARAQETRAGGVPDGLADALSKAANRAAAWPVDDADAETLWQGAEHAYRCGRKELAAAVRDPSPERLHEWRKRVKDLWYHHRLLRDVWQGPMKAYTDEYDELGGLLGDDHDLAVLAAALSGDLPPPPSVDLPALLESIAARRGALQRQAFALGRHAYLEKPKAFGRRLGGHLAAPRDSS